jgi:hypothetical protein
VVCLSGGYGQTQLLLAQSLLEVSIFERTIQELEADYSLSNYSRDSAMQVRQ